MNRELTENEMHMITDKWDETNELRVELIKQDIDSVITDKDQILLDYLQELAKARRNLLALLPTADELLQTNPLNALTMQQLEQLEQAGIQQDKIIYQVHVTGLDERDRNMQDIPETYLVEKNEQADGGCVVYGWNEGLRANKNKWYVNPSLRWLVNHLVEKVSNDRKLNY